MQHRRTWLTAGLGLGAVVAGVVVLRGPGAQVEIGWFSYEGPPSAALLDSLVAWNPVRVVGAVLVLLGLVVLARLLGVLAARRRDGALPARLAERVLVLVLANVLVLGGLVAFVVTTEVDPVGAMVTFSSSVWTRNQFSAALVVATGLVVGAVGSGLRREHAPHPSKR